MSVTVVTNGPDETAGSTPSRSSASGMRMPPSAAAVSTVTIASPITAAMSVVRNQVPDAALRAWCAERLSDYKVPETMDLMTDPLPRNANGKVMKRQLREASPVILAAAQS